MPDLRHLQNFPNLGHLRLDGTRVTGEGLQASRRWRTSASFTCVALRWATKISPRLPNRRSLLRLWLANTQVTDQGLKCLRECGQLNALCLSGIGPGISDAALSGLADIPTLGEIALQDANVTAAGAAHFKARLPRCKVSLSNEVQDELDELLQKSAAVSSTVAPWTISVGGRLEVEFPNHDRRWTTSVPNGPFQVTRIQIAGDRKDVDRSGLRPAPRVATSAVGRSGQHPRHGPDLEDPGGIAEPGRSAAFVVPIQRYRVGVSRSVEACQTAGLGVQ